MIRPAEIDDRIAPVEPRYLADRAINEASVAVYAIGIDELDPIALFEFRHLQLSLDAAPELAR